MNVLDSLIKTLSKLPGLGRKTAIRLAFFMIKADQRYLQDLGNQILTIRDKIRKCSICGNFTEGDPCEICIDSSRDQKTICVVEQVQDLMTLNASGEFRGLFHVLHGVISPLDGVGPEALRLYELEDRVRKNGVEEVILATNPTMEGDTTALYIHRLLSEKGVKITRLASGIPVGGDIEYTDKLTIARSLRARTTL